MTQSELFLVLEKAQRASQAFVVFRYPNTETIRAYVVDDVVEVACETDAFSGFVMAAFDRDTPTIRFSKEACSIYEAPQQLGLEISPGHVFEEGALAKASHVSLVEQGVAFLRENSCEKVVLSRKIEHQLTNFDCYKGFATLLHYSNAFVYYWFHPEKGTWMGATPETLVQSKGNSFTTMALAGTIKITDDSAIVWGAKEIHEQQVVTDYIKGKLVDLPLQVSEPYTVKAGNVAHIRTDISGELTEQVRLQTLIERLHPTPAVCGIPVELSRQFIRTHEPYNREFYTGYLGEYNVAGQSKIFVNLRCMKVLPSLISVYVGGGITTASIPLAEWQETCEKAKLMLRLL